MAIVAIVLDEDWYVMVREIEAETGKQRTTVHRILNEHLFMKQVALWWVLNALTDAQKQTHLEIAQEDLKLFRMKEKNF